MGDREPTPTPSPTSLRNAGTGRCPDVPGVTTTNTQVQVYACADTAAQRWTATAGGQLTALGGQKCLDVNTATLKVRLWACWGGDNQKW